MGKYTQGNHRAKAREGMKPSGDSALTVIIRDTCIQKVVKAKENHENQAGPATLNMSTFLKIQLYRRV